MSPLNNATLRALTARAQLLKPAFKVGKEGLTPPFIAALDEALRHHDLLKVKFADLKEQKHELAPQLAERTGSRIVMQVGHVVVLYRPLPASNAPAEAETRAAS